MNKAAAFLARSPATMPARGFGLVELMVAVAISLALLLGIGFVYIGAKQTFRTQDDFSRIQENVRYALETLGVDVRMAGYSGCVNLAAIDPLNPGGIPINVIAGDPPDVTLGDALRGYAPAAWPAELNPVPANWVANTGIIAVSRASSQGVRLTGNMGTDNANIQIAGNPTGIVAEQALLISDCQSADLFRATNVSAAGGTVTIAHANSNCGTLNPVVACNSDNRLSKAYSTDAELYAISSTVYFIGTNPAGNPSLYRRQEGGNAEELVENVENIVMRFGRDTNTDFVVDGYVDAAAAAANWRQVLTVRMSLVFRSNADNVATEDQDAYVVEFEEIDLPAADRRLRQVVTATYGLRNRLP